MRRGPKRETVRLTVEENNRLVEWTRGHKTSQAFALRAQTVGKRRGRDRRLDGCSMSGGLARRAASATRWWSK
jgi:hypothetical protein